MKYKIVKNCDYYKLMDDVNLLISQGWKLQGGVTAAITLMDDVEYVQAMIIDDNTNVSQRW